VTGFDHIGEDVDMRERAKPGIDVNANATNTMDVIVVNSAVAAGFLDVDSLFVAFLNKIVGNFKIDGAADADRFVRRRAPTNPSAGAMRQVFACLTRFPTIRIL
jgi:hypothetical protein